MEYLDFQLDLLQIPTDLKKELGAKFSCLGELCKVKNIASIPEVWKVDKAMNEFGLTLKMETGSTWVAPKERKVFPVSPEDVSKILDVGICENENLIRIALSVNSSVNQSVRWLIENERIEKLRLQILRKNGQKHNAGIERAWNPGHGIISEGNANVKFLRREGNPQAKKQTFWVPQSRYRNVLASNAVKAPKEGVQAPCEHQQPPEVQREGRSREESESGEDAELISAPSVPVREGLDGSDYSSEKEEDFGMQVQAMLKDLVEDQDSGEPERSFGVIGERRKSDQEGRNDEVEEQKEESESKLNIEPLIPSKPPQPMKSLIDHNSQPHSYFSRSPGHGRPWALNAHHKEGPKPVCNFNLRPKQIQSAADLNRIQRMQHMEYLRVQQQRKRAIENYRHDPYYSQALRAELLRESEAMMFEEMRRQEAMRRFEIGPGFDGADRRGAWEAARRRDSQFTRPTGREYHQMQKAQQQQQDPMNTAYWQGHGYNGTGAHASNDQSEEVRAFGRQTILENLDHSHPHAPLDPRSNRAENFVYFPDRDQPSSNANFSKAPGEPVRAKSDGCYIMTPSPPPPSKQQSIHNHHHGIFSKRDIEDQNQNSFSPENLVENSTHPNSKPWHPFVPVKPEKSKLNHSESPVRSASPPIASESKPSKSASSDKLNMQTFIKSLSAAKLPKKEEPLNNDQLNFWQKLVKTTKETERENVENFFKMFKNSSPNRTEQIREPVDFEDDFNQDLDLMKELAFLNNADTTANKSCDIPAVNFFESLLRRSKETILSISASNSEDESEEEFEPEELADKISEPFEDSEESGEQKSDSPVIRDSIEPDGGPPNYLELEPPPPIDKDEVAPEQNDLKVNDEEFLASPQEKAIKRGSWQTQKQPNPEVEHMNTDQNLYRSRIENLLHQHDTAKLKNLDNPLAQFIDSTDSVEVESLNNSAPELFNKEPVTQNPPLLKQDPDKSEKPSTPFENAI